MAHEIFISYAAEDKAIADAVCQAIESQHIKCWYAPRDVEYGKDFEESIVDAIAASRLVILILTSHANHSAHVKREIQNACMEEVAVPVLPFRTEDIPLNKSLRYYIGSVHWLDAVTTPMEPHLQRLVEHVRAGLTPAVETPSPTQTHVQEESAIAAAPIAPASIEVSEPVVKQIEIRAEDKEVEGESEGKASEKHRLTEPAHSPPRRSKAWPIWALPVAGALLVLIVVGSVTGWYLNKSKRGGLNEFTYHVVELDKNGSVVKRWSGTREFFTENLGDGITLEMVPLPAGKFLMGTPDAESTDGNGRPLHEVNVPKFSIGKYEITQAQWRVVSGLPKIKIDLDPDPSHWKGLNLPVDKVGWSAAMEFCERLSKKTGRTYRLPSEAEWEYACRAGTTTPFAFGQTITLDVVNYNSGYPYGGAIKQQERNTTVAVGSLGVANRFGLFDMHGNVAEWCLDPPHSTYVGAPTDGSPWLGPQGLEAYEHMIRGGGLNSGYLNRSGHRESICDVCSSGAIGYYKGFRVVTVAK